MIPFGIYFHWPFCKSKCPYCDFVSTAAKNVDFQAWKDAYLSVLERYAARTGEKTVSSVFFGGGTPSLMPPELIAELVSAVRRLWKTDEDAEISMEANPAGTLDAEKLNAFRKAGVTRLSLGIQSLNDADLRFLGRLHDSKTAVDAFKTAQNIFPEVSADFIYALPHQTFADWKSELERILSLNADHLSLYQLTLEEGTFFYKKGLEMPEESLCADMFELTDRMTYQAGLERYEVSNHARKGRKCRHNLLYWQGGEWLGIGPAAHGRFTENGNHIATAGGRKPFEWLKTRETAEETLTVKERAEELILMGMRTSAGVLRDRFKQITGADVEQFIYADTLEDYQSDGLMISDKKGLRATAKGLLIVNALCASLIR